MSTVIAFPSPADRAVGSALAEFGRDRSAGIEQMMRLALEHSDPGVRARASRWLAEVLNVKTT